MPRLATGKVMEARGIERKNSWSGRPGGGRLAGGAKTAGGACLSQDP